MATEGGVESRARPGRPLIGYGLALPRTDQHALRPSSSVPTLTPRSSSCFSPSLFPSLSLSFERVTSVGSPPAVEVISLGTPKPRSLLLALHLSIRLPSVYSSCSPSFTLVTPFFFCFFLPFPRFSLPLSLSLSLSLSLFPSPRKLCEQVLCSFSLSLVPCPFVSSCAHRSHHCSKLCGSSSLRLLLQPAHHITALFIKASAIATATNRPPLNVTCPVTLASREYNTPIRRTFGSVWTPLSLALRSTAITVVTFIVCDCLEMETTQDE